MGTAQDDTGGLSAKHTALVFSGGLSVAEFERSANTAITSSTQPTVQYGRGPDMGGGVGGLLYTVRDTTTKYNLSNGRGDIVAQSDTTGALTWTASYEAFGKRTKETGTNADKQRANTKDEDPTGLLNEGFRYRDIETGVWLSRDPAGFVDGPNLYAYVMQNPWTAFDPDGLKLRIPDKQKKSFDSYIRGNGVLDHKFKNDGHKSNSGEKSTMITGSAYYGSYSSGNLKAEIISTMIRSDRLFEFANAGDMESHVQGRMANVSYLRKLAAHSESDSNSSNYSFGGNHYPSSWTQTGGEFGPAKGVTWKEALSDLANFQYPSFDCSRPLMYGRMWGEISAGSDSPTLTPYSNSISFTEKTSDYIPGDLVRVHNNNTIGVPAQWSKENTVYLGQRSDGVREFYANGMSKNPTTLFHVIEAVTNKGTVSGGQHAPATVDSVRTHVGYGLQSQ